MKLVNPSRVGDRTTSGQAADKEDGTPYRWPLSSFHLVGLAAGGVFGSGWITAQSRVYHAVGANAWLVWIVGGLLMLIVAWVMVELGREAPRTGGLIFLPLDSSGPLVATVVAAGLWIFYVINLASESISMTDNSVGQRDLFRHVSEAMRSDGLTVTGWLTVVGFMTAISALNLLLPRIFFRVNSWITVLKIGIIVATAALILSPFSGLPPHATAQASGTASTPGHGWSTILTTVVNGSVIYAYLGFQGPLDFAGDIRRSPARQRPRRGQSTAGDDPDLQRAWEASRLSRAVLGTVAGSVLLFLALQFAFARYPVELTPKTQTPFVTIAGTGHHLDVLVWALRIGDVLAPMGAGLVFCYALTREVAALGRVRLAPRGLQTAHRTTMGRHPGIYWLVLLVNLTIGIAVLALVHVNWETMTQVTGVLALIVYAMPGVVLVAEADRFTKASQRRRTVRNAMARVSFALIGLVLYMTGWSALWRSMATIGTGSALLLGLPLVSLRWPGFARFYDARAHALLFRRWRADAAVHGVFVLLGYLMFLLLLAWGNHKLDDTTFQRVAGALAVSAAALAFELLVRASRRYTAAAGEPQGEPEQLASAAR